MLSFGQQNAPGANCDYSDVYNQQWKTDPSNFNDGLSSITQFNNTKNPEASYQISTYYQTPNQFADWPQAHVSQSYGSFSTHNHVEQTPNCAQFQTNQWSTPQSSWPYPTSNSYVQQPKSVNTTTSARKHQACISLIPKASGGFKTIIKRKRKRTMFTTEQVEVLESVFQTKPYVTREDRQILVQQLQLSDTSVKVWFQNRRLRGKREELEAAEETLYVNAQSTKIQLQGNPTQYSPDYLERLDYIESELQKKADESGYLLLDDRAIQMIVDVIDSALSIDIDFETLSNISDTATDSSSCVTDSSGCAADFESSNTSETEVPSISNEMDSDSSTSTDEDSCNHDNVPIYEPISPAESKHPDEPVKSWKPTKTDILQTLFDLHFC